MTLLLGVKKAAFFWLPLFFILHHLEPNRTMLWELLEGGGRQLLYLAIVFRNGNGSYHNDTVLIWLGKYRKPVINPGPVCLCWFDSTISVLIWLPLCTTQMWYLCCFHAAQTGLQNKPAAVTLNPYKTVITCPS